MTNIALPLLSEQRHDEKREWEVARSSRTKKTFKKLFRRNAVTAFNLRDGAQEFRLLFGGSNERFVVVTGEYRHNGALRKGIAVQDYLSANDCTSSNSHGRNLTPITGRGGADEAERFKAKGAARLYRAALLALQGINGVRVI